MTSNLTIEQKAALLDKFMDEIGTISRQVIPTEVYQTNTVPLTKEVLTSIIQLTKQYYRINDDGTNA